MEYLFTTGNADENKTEKQKMEEVLANAKKVSPSDALAALKSKREANK